jgi:hypothetical protein
MVYLAVALLAGSPLSAPAAEPASESAKILEEIRDLKKSVTDRMDQLERSVRDAQNKAASVDDRLYRLQREALTTDDVRQLKNQIDQLQRDLDTLRGQMTTVRESLKPGSPAPGTSRSLTPGEFGTLRVRNDYFTRMDVVVNGQRHTMAPGSETSIPVPAGTVNFQVIGVDTVPRVRTILGGQVHPVTIHPVS